jgi:endonuclease/exonuclease/phosphatase family metal-dependent hydrolase
LKPPWVYAFAIGTITAAVVATAHDHDPALAPLAPAFSEPRQITHFAVSRHLASVSLVTWNIDRGEHLAKISGELSSNTPDLCVLQEVDLNALRSGGIDVAQELGEKLHLNVVYGVEFEELGQEQGKPAYIGQATLSRLPIRAARILRFQHQSNFWKPRSWIPSSVGLFQRRLGSRMALVTELELNGRLLVVYNAHLESRSYGRIQAEQLDEILADARRYAPNTLILLAGDLNTKYLPSHFLRKLEKAGFTSATGQRIERTHAIAMSLDWIFLRGPAYVEGGRVARNFTGSDHYPVFATLVPEKL